MSESVDPPAVVVPQFCRAHQHELIVQELGIPETGPWMSTLVVAGILMFQAATASERIWKRADGREGNPTCTP